LARYVIRRILVSIVLLLVISIVVFTVMRLLPGDPALSRLGGAKFIGSSAIADLRKSMGLDQPLIVQYGQWIAGVVTGNFGLSFANGYPVATLIGQRLFPTAELAIGGLIIAVVIAVGFSLLSAVNRKRIARFFVEGYTIFGLSAPPFVIGIILILVLAVSLSAVPVGGYVDPSKNLGGNLRSVILPAFTLGIAVSAPLIQYLLSSMTEVSHSLFVRTARGKGLPWKSVVFRHIFPNGVLPALTSLGISVGVLLGGVVEVEYVFSWPGLGSLMVDSVQSRDYSLIQTIVVLASAIVILSNLVVDLLYGVLDPRLRIQSRPTAPRVEVSE
jgi:peptide/nickel transport system permease protein